MPGPFPGMDPYLEDPARWPDVHQGIISALRARLNSQLPAGYVANMGERCQVIPTERSIYPDVLVHRSPGVPPPQSNRTTTLELPDPPLIFEELPLEPNEPYIEIRNVADGRRLVAVIELLSSANKEVGSEGQRRYRQKQQEILASRTHLIEIDLLRAGQHTVAAPRPSTPYLYLVVLHRGGEGRRFAVWPNQLRERLPHIAVPLENGIPDVTLDLQAAFDRNYDEGAYALQLDYAGTLFPRSRMRRTDGPTPCCANAACVRDGQAICGHPV